MDKKYTHRDEIVERNPFLAKNWFCRYFAGAIIMGARLDAQAGKSFKLLLFSGPVLLFVLSIDFFIGTPMSTVRRTLGLILIVYLSFCYIMIAAGFYGYINRDKIDATGAFKANFKNTWRYGFIGAGIGATLNGYLGDSF